MKPDLANRAHLRVVGPNAGSDSPLFGRGSTIRCMSSGPLGKIAIFPLPPYSPKLNPMENLWHYLRSHYWSNRVFGDYAGLCDAAEMAW